MSLSLAVWGETWVFGGKGVPDRLEIAFSGWAKNHCEKKEDISKRDFPVVLFDGFAV